MRTTLRMPVFLPSIAIVALLLALCTLMPEASSRAFGVAQTWVGAHFGWFYTLSVGIFVLVLIAIACSGYGNIRLGPDDSRPEFGFPTWLSMLFAAGMGIGLMYFGVAEPMQHFLAPPTGVGITREAAQTALTYTFFHWGIHAWAIYALVGLVLAYFGFRYNLPLTIRSGLYPLLRERINGPIGHAVDTFALCGTLFGLTTTLGYGVLQISAGLHDMFGWDTATPGFRVGLIVVVTLIAGASAASGLGKGLRRLSEMNLALAVLLMLFVAAVGPTLVLLQTFGDNLGNYLSNLVSLTFLSHTYAPTNDPKWFEGWTLLYWAWWISWSPFVGMFIARISRGRTIREFIVGVLLVPSLFNFVWMTVFGNAAIWFDTNAAAGALSAAASNVDSLLFVFLNYMPLASWTTGLTLLLIGVFFVTSADSGTFVMDAIASGGRNDSPIWQRLFWAALVALTTSLLLLAGGLDALRAMTIISALPFTVVMLALCVGLWRGLVADRTHSTQTQAPTTTIWTGQHWKRRLEQILNRPTEKQVKRFIAEHVRPALEEVAAALRAREVEVRVELGDDGNVALKVPRDGLRDFVYGVQTVQTRVPAYILRDTDANELAEPYDYVPMTFFEDGRLGYDVQYLNHQEIINDVLKQYERYLVLMNDPRTQLLNAAPGHT